jgi:hypothetical protein
LAVSRICIAVLAAGRPDPQRIVVVPNSRVITLKWPKQVAQTRQFTCFMSALAPRAGSTSQINFLVSISKTTGDIPRRLRCALPPPRCFPGRCSAIGLAASDPPANPGGLAPPRNRPKKPAARRVAKLVSPIPRCRVWDLRCHSRNERVLDEGPEVRRFGGCAAARNCTVASRAARRRGRARSARASDPPKAAAGPGPHSKNGAYRTGRLKELGNGGASRTRVRTFIGVNKRLARFQRCRV